MNDQVLSFRLGWLWASYTLESLIIKASIILLADSPETIYDTGALRMFLKNDGKFKLTIT